MSKEISDRIVSKLNKKNNIKGLILGATFKENCPDIRNSKVFDVYQALNKHKFKIDIYDPYASKIEVLEQYGINLIEFSKIKKKDYDFIIIAVPHDEFINLNINMYCKNKQTIVFDVRNIFAFLIWSGSSVG